MSFSMGSVHGSSELVHRAGEQLYFLSQEIGQNVENAKLYPIEGKDDNGN